jgi:hypothetical protein
MDTKIIAAIIGLLGLFLGSILNGIGYYLRERYKRIRIINQTIFYLFKVLHITLALKNMDKKVELYLEKLSEHPDIKKNHSVDKNTEIKLMNDLIASLITPITQKTNEVFKQKFNDSIFELSSVKPVIAYHLSKSSYQEALSREIEQMLKNEKNNDGFKRGIKASQKYIFTDLETKLKKGINNLSLNSGILNWISCHYEFYKLKKKYTEKEMKSSLNTYFEKTILPLMEQHKDQKMD